MDGTGQEQDAGTRGHPLPDSARIDEVPETLRAEHGTDISQPAEVGEGRLATSQGKAAVRNQSVVSPDAYAGSSESGA